MESITSESNSTLTMLLKLFSLNFAFAAGSNPFEYYQGSVEKLNKTSFYRGSEFFHRLLVSASQYFLSGIQTINTREELLSDIDSKIDRSDLSTIPSDCVTDNMKTFLELVSQIDRFFQKRYGYPYTESFDWEMNPTEFASNWFEFYTHHMSDQKNAKKLKTLMQEFANKKNISLDMAEFSITSAAMTFDYLFQRVKQNNPQDFSVEDASAIYSLTQEQKHRMLLEHLQKQSVNIACFQEANEIESNLLEEFGYIQFITNEMERTSILIQNMLSESSVIVDLSRYHSYENLQKSKLTQTMLALRVVYQGRVIYILSVHLASKNRKKANADVAQGQEPNLKNHQDQLVILTEFMKEIKENEREADIIVGMDANHKLPEEQIEHIKNNTYVSFLNFDITVFKMRTWMQPQHDKANKIKKEGIDTIGSTLNVIDYHTETLGLSSEDELIPSLNHPSDHKATVATFRF